jgi:hypothetical protein
MKDESMLKKKVFDAAPRSRQRCGRDIGKGFTLSRLQYFAAGL